ncbi:hypothetical protein CCUS01_05253 [Colletotrichum cuscutae]|uniref:Uncharacterized protein n=1 Tax=Colletotrichum cuscutae TaxID=1209917 RepID=A0AAI9Y2X6_9PEZI|nr:hypothetical protein CCUS01_05253 [Colletotrichum cuscutae]
MRTQSDNLEAIVIQAKVFVLSYLHLHVGIAETGEPETPRPQSMYNALPMRYIAASSDYPSLVGRASNQYCTHLCKLDSQLATCYSNVLLIPVILRTSFKAQTLTQPFHICLVFVLFSSSIKEWASPPNHKLIMSTSSNTASLTIKQSPVPHTIPIANQTTSQTLVRPNASFDSTQTVDGIYTPRETGVLVRCSLADIIHGQAIVFDFQLDRIKATRRIRQAIISLTLPEGIRVRKGGLSPKGRVSYHPQAMTLSRSNESSLSAGLCYGASIECGVKRIETVSLDTTEYATVNGWTTRQPKGRVNDQRPHNCVKWALMENPALPKHGVPPHFRAAVFVGIPITGILVDWFEPSPMT